MLLKILSVIEVIILLLSAILVVPQILLLRKQLKNQHEENRRINTVKYMSNWCCSLKKDTCVAEQVGRKLNSEQCKNLYCMNKFDVSSDIKDEICKFCSLNSTHCARCSLNNGYTVDGKILTELRWHTITYLNTLETTLLGWSLGIVDKETIEEQFAFVADPQKSTTLSQFRHIAGGYPVIEKFIDEVKGKGNANKESL